MERALRVPLRRTETRKYYHMVYNDEDLYGFVQMLAHV
jgi:hypothetical protein